VEAPSRAGHAVPAVAFGLASLVLAPVLRPGVVLVQDMVFVPRQPWRADWLGLGPALPRAVPADAVVSALTAVVDGALLQKLVLLAALGLAGWGAGRLVPADGLLGRLAATVLYAWNPYVAERLLLGQWTLLVAHAALPWALAGALAVRRGEPGAVARTLLAVGAASLTATGGLLAAAVALAGAGRRSRVLLAGGAALQAPWLVPALLAPAGGGSDPAGVDAFAARAESWAGTAGSLLGLGGVWNAAAVPGSRTSAAAPVLTLALLAVVALGLPALWRRWGAAATGLAVVAAGGLVLALAGALPAGADLLRALVEAVPGAGLLRDGQKWLPPLALLYAVGAGLGVERIAAAPVRAPLAVGAALLPLAVLPDLAWGVAGRLEPVRYPADFAAVRAVLQSDDHPGAVLSLPFSAYRAFDWNDRRSSLDPAPRWFDEEVVVDDRLPVGPTVVAGEDRRSALVRRALQEQRPLGEVGVGWLLVARGTPGAVPAQVTDGARLVHDGPALALWRVPDVREVDVATPPAAPVLVADAVAAAVLVTAAAGTLGAGSVAGWRSSGRTRRRPPAPR
jgi:hypothetical protein